MDEIATQTSRRRQRRLALATTSLFAASCAGVVALINYRADDDIHPDSPMATTMQFNPNLPLHIQNMILEARSNNNTAATSFVRRNNNNKALSKQGHGNGSSRKLSAAASSNSCIDFWHVSILDNEPNTCTNSGHYPPEWSNSNLVDYMFHTSSDKCCEEMLRPWVEFEDAPGVMPTCAVVDACPPPPPSASTLASDSEGGGGGMAGATVDERCAGKWFMECIQDHECQFDEATHTCLAMEASVGIEQETAPNLDNDNPCGGNPKWMCLADPRCQFDITSNACVMRDYDDATTTTVNDNSSGSDVSTVTITDNSGCTGKKKKECLRFGCQYDNWSKTCFTPSLAPTKSPIPSPIDNINSSCEQRKFHPTSVLDRKCSNNAEYPSIWTNLDMVQKYFFATASECCAAFYSDGSCEVDDICAAPTTDTDNRINRSGQETSLPGPQVMVSCREKTNSKKACLRDARCEWDRPTRTCLELPGVPTEAPTMDCVNQVWHMSTELTYTCTNDGNYLSGLPTFSSSDECCATTFPNKPCHVVDLCYESYPPTTPYPTTSMPTPWPTPSPVTPIPTQRPVIPRPVSLTVDGKVVDPNCYAGKEWHKSRRVGAEDKCTNDNDISNAWLHPAIRPYYLFTTPTECCQSNFEIPNCDLVDVCVEGTYPPTYRPTTAYPTMEPFPTYTPSETPPHARAGTMCSARWHISESEPNTCTNDEDYPESWKSPAKRDLFLFRTAKICCDALFPDEECYLYNICPDGVPTHRPTTESPTTKRPTKEPTPNPTRRPTQRPITDAVWYNDRTIGKCVQDCDGEPPCGGFKSEWDIAYRDSITCCASMAWKEYDDCLMTPAPSEPPPPTFSPTIYVSPPPTPRPTNQPITQRPTPPTLDCSTLKWHMSDAQDEPLTCTNDPEYPEEWLDRVQFFFHDTPEKCCSKAFGGSKMDCKHRDACGGNANSGNNGNVEYTISGGGKQGGSSGSTNTSGSAGGCSENKWHMSIVPGDETTCTNDKEYPPPWDQNTAYFLKDTSEACCQAFYNGVDCNVKDVCGNGNSYVSNSGNGDTSVSDGGGNQGGSSGSTNTSGNGGGCSGNKWHMSIVPGDMMTCTNDKEYPPPWDQNPPQYLKDTSEACCQAFYGGMGSCTVKDICGDGNVGPSQSENQQVGNEGDPGPAPTPTQTTGSCSGKEWHMSTVPGDDMTCTNDDKYPPAWKQNAAHFFHSSSDACCTKFYGGLDCKVKDVCNSGVSQDQQAGTENQGQEPGGSETAFVTISEGISDDFEGRGTIPWIMGNPPQWRIDDTEAASGIHSITNIISKELAATRTLTMKVNVSTSGGLMCKVKIDTSMPFDRFSLHVNEEPRKTFYQRQDDWVNLSTQLTPGENLVQFKVANGDMFPNFDRSTFPSKYGTGHVWLDDCQIHI